MKRMTFMLLLFVAVVAIYAQNYKVLGKDDGFPPDCVWKVEVSDSYNGAPIPNAEVSFYDGTLKKWSINTNQRGVAVVIIHDIAAIIGEAHGYERVELRVRDQSYEYNAWKKEIEQYDYWKGDYVILLGDNQRSGSVVASLVLADTYRRVERYNSPGSPGFFDFKVVLDYIKHPKDQRGNSSYSPSPSPSPSQNGNPYASWSEKTNSNGEVVFYKGAIELTIMSMNSKYPDYHVSIARNGDEFYEKTFVDNEDGRDDGVYSFEMALNKCKKYIRDH